MTVDSRTMMRYTERELIVCKLVAEVHARNEWVTCGDIAEAMGEMGHVYTARNVSNALNNRTKELVAGTWVTGHDHAASWIWHTVRNGDGVIVGAHQGGTGGRDNRPLTELGARPASERCPLAALIRQHRLHVAEVKA